MSKKRLVFGKMNTEETENFLKEILSERDSKDYLDSIKDVKNIELVYYGDKEENRWSLENLDDNSVILDHEIYEQLEKKENNYILD